MLNNKESGMTLMEVLIVIGVLVILAIIAILTIDPKAQLGKGWDSKRKKDLDTTAKIFEDYYNDKNCYPKPIEVCYTGVTPFLTSGVSGCLMCGGSLEPYTSQLPCDPANPNKDYLYTFDNESCPSKFVIYAPISNKKDVQSEEEKCTDSSCGPIEQSEGYGFYEASPNGTPLTNLCSEQAYIYCIDKSPSENCNNCGDLEQCKDKGDDEGPQGCNLSYGLFLDPSCNRACGWVR